MNGETISINETTGEKLIIKFGGKKSWGNDRILEGECFDKDGKKVYTLSGSWLTKIYLTSCATKEVEMIWNCDDLPAEDPKQYNFRKFSCALNHFSEEMNGVIAPTDSRLRGDMRLFEEGKMDLADAEKVRLEVKQR